MSTNTLPEKELSPSTAIDLELNRCSWMMLDARGSEFTALYSCPAVTRPAPEPSQSIQIELLKNRVWDLYSLPESERWPGSGWPSDEAFKEAWDFTERLPTRLKALPHISLADDGEVNFAWANGTIRIDLGFYGTGTFSYFACDGRGQERFGDDVPVRSEIPRVLKELLAG